MIEKLKTYKMIINKQKVLNFVLTLQAGWRKIPPKFLQRTETKNETLHQVNFHSCYY